MAETNAPRSSRPLTLEGLALRLARYATQTDRRLQHLEEMVKTNSPNGMVAIVHKLEPLAEAADDLAVMARDHREQRELRAATAIVESAAQRAHQRRLEHLRRHWWYRRYEAAAAFLGDSTSKLYYAVIGAIGLYLVMQGWPHLQPLFSLLHLGGPAVNAPPTPR